MYICDDDDRVHYPIQLCIAVNKMYRKFEDITKTNIEHNEKYLKISLAIFHL